MICEIIGATEETGFLAIKDGVSYCWFDGIAIIFGAAMLLGLVFIIYNSLNQKESSEELV